MLVYKHTMYIFYVTVLEEEAKWEGGDPTCLELDWIS